MNVSVEENKKVSCTAREKSSNNSIFCALKDRWISPIVCVFCPKILDKELST